MKKTLSIIVVAVYLIVNLVFIYHQFRSHTPVVTASTVVEVSELKGKKHIGTCEDETLLSQVAVYFADSIPSEKENTTISGQTRTDQHDGIQIILLKNLNDYTGLIAHETSHAIDTILSAKHINDGETRAYLSAFYVNCITRKVNYETKEKEKYSPISIGWSYAADLDCEDRAKVYFNTDHVMSTASSTSKTFKTYDCYGVPLTQLPDYYNLLKYAILKNKK